MPKKHAAIMIKNLTSYDNVQYDSPGARGTIPRDKQISIDTDGATFDIEIQIKDQHDKKIRYVKFHSDCADHWAVHDHGVQLEGSGRESDGGHPRDRKDRIGETHEWTFVAK